MYRMGLLPADAVPDVWVFADQDQFAGSRSGLPTPGLAVAGRTNRMTIGSIVAHHGPRRGPSPTSWLRATVVVSNDGLLSQREMDYWNFFAQRLEDPNRTGVKSYDLYPSFDTLTANRVDLQTDIVPRTAEPIIHPLSVDSPDFGRLDWPGVVFDGAVPSRYSTGTRTRLSGRVTDTSRNFDTLLVRLWKHDGGSDQALRYWTPISADGSFAIDIAPASLQTGHTASESFSSRLTQVPSIRVQFCPLVGDKFAFVNFTPELLLGGYETALPARSTVIEILESIEPDDDVIAACRHLSASGYKIALDDFIYRPGFEALIEAADRLRRV